MSYMSYMVNKCAPDPDSDPDTDPDSLQRNPWSVIRDPAPDAMRSALCRVRVRIRVRVRVRNTAPWTL